MSVRPDKLLDFFEVVPKIIDHANDLMGIETELFYNLHAYGEIRFCTFTDFRSVREYGELFLDVLFNDTKYCELIMQSLESLVTHPVDELFSRERTDTSLLGDSFKVASDFTFDSATEDNNIKRQYRREREYRISKGRIRELIRINFQFMEDFYRATNDAPKTFFSRFAASGLGSLRMHLDVDDILVCDRALLEQIQTLSSATPGLLTSQPIDSWYVRVTPEYREFELRKAKAGGRGLSDKVRRSRSADHLFPPS
jgi:hypothetical protein